MKPSSLHLITSAAAATRDASQRGRWYPLAFVAGFLVVFAVNGVLITTAISSFSGLDTDSAYQEGLTYNATIAAVRAQEALGWEVNLETSARPASDGTGHELNVTASFADRDGRPISNQSVELHFRRPTQQGQDFDAALARKGLVVYGASVRVPLSGQWDMTVVAHYRSGDGSDKTWQTTRRIYLP